MKIPVVNDRDEVIDLKERSEITPNEYYRVSAAWITNSQGDVLMAQRALSKKNDPGKWGPAVAGTVEEHETYTENIVKEIQEELGVSIPLSDLKTGPKIRRINPNARYFCQWYFATTDLPLSSFKIEAEEVADLKWISAAELRSEIETTPEHFIPSASSWIGVLI